ncbi:esterase [compost metagenome]
MSHGFAAVKELYIDKFAEHFAEAGFVVVLYDHRNFGKSGGDTKGEIVPYQQVEDMREVLTWVAQRNDVDASRIGVWGSSFSGGHAITIGALDRRVSCVVSQVPTISGYQNLLRRAGVQIHSVLKTFQADRAARYLGEAPRYRRVIAEDGEPGIFSSDGAEEFFGAAETLAEGWQNRVTMRSSEKASEYEPGLLIDRISPTPLLMLVAERDSVTPTDLAIAAYHRALEPKRLVMLPDGHFDPYVKHADRAKKEALEWFKMHLQLPLTQP